MTTKNVVRKEPRSATFDSFLIGLAAPVALFAPMPLDTPARASRDVIGRSFRIVGPKSQLGAEKTRGGEREAQRRKPESNNRTG